MSELFRQWSSNNPNCTFHYLSSIPHEFYRSAEEFLNENRFPRGSFHTRLIHWDVDWLAHFFDFDAIRKHKLDYLNFFLINTRRHFVLVGDSSNYDPEIYGIIARKYPERIRAIFIRTVANESFVDERFYHAFNGVETTKWIIFHDTKQIPIDLSRAPRTMSH
jgi:phosphatidate phosphatase APP1